MKVYIIIVNYKNYNDTIQCLRSLLLCNYPNKSIIIIDNNSGNESVQQIVRFFNKKNMEYNVLYDEVTKKYNNLKSNILIISSKNRGYGGAINLGLKFIFNHDENDFYIWVLNPDTFVFPNSIKALIHKIESDSDYMIIGSKVYSIDGKIQFYGGAYLNKFTMISKYVNSNKYANLSEKEIESLINYIGGSAMFFRKKYFEIYGYFDERFFLYFEDVDLSFRLKKPHKIGYCSNSIIIHKQGTSAGTSFSIASKSATSIFHSIRSRMIFTKKYFPFILPIVVMISIIYIIAILLVKKKVSFAKIGMQAIINGILN